MGKFVINKSQEHINVLGYNQCFDDEDKKELWDMHKILYVDGIVALWVEEQENFNRLVHIMEEDDGQLYWNKERDICFHTHWLDNYIETFSELKNLLAKS